MIVCFSVFSEFCVYFQSDMIKEAEICAYFKRFDEAEKLYIEMDRRY